MPAACDISYEHGPLLPNTSPTSVLLLLLMPLQHCSYHVTNNPLLTRTAHAVPILVTCDHVSSGSSPSSGLPCGDPPPGFAQPFQLRLTRSQGAPCLIPGSPLFLSNLHVPSFVFCLKSPLFLSDGDHAYATPIYADAIKYMFPEFQTHVPSCLMDLFA